jgi:hypothetical protein
VQRRIELKPSLSVASKRTVPQWHWPARTFVSSTITPNLLFRLSCSDRFYDIPRRITKPSSGRRKQRARMVEDALLDCRGI